MEKLTFNECCISILNSEKTDGYAKAYAQAGIGMTGRTRHIQALYILNNIQYWRGEGHKEVRAALKTY